jgi:hypothetical protein
MGDHNNKGFPRFRGSGSYVIYRDICLTVMSHNVIYLTTTEEDPTNSYDSPNEVKDPTNRNLQLISGWPTSINLWDQVKQLILFISYRA